MAGIFRKNLAIRFRPSGYRRAVFVDFAKREGNTINWDNAEKFALSQYEAALIFNALRKYNINNNKVVPIEFTHAYTTDGSRSKTTKTLKIGHTKDGDLAIAFISKTGRKTTAKFSVTINPAESILIETTLSAFLIQITIPNLRLSNRTASNTDTDTDTESSEGIVF